MALARACLKSSELLQRRSLATALYSYSNGISRPNNHCHYYSSSASSAQEVAVTSDSSSPATESGRGRKRGLAWRSPLQLSDNIGVGNALMQVSQNLNKLLENWMPSRLLGRVKEDDKCYKLRYGMPGIAKEDLKITVEDGYLVISGESKEEEEEEEEEGWFSQRFGYGYYNSSVMLPDDAKVEEIRAELKDGILTIYIPRSGETRRNVKEIQIE